MDFSFRLTTPADIPDILSFERTNRRFFEKTVPPRPSAYFDTPTAFRDKMAALLGEQRDGKFLMFIILSNDQAVIARVNITIDDSHSATLGFRCAENQKGKGLIAKALIRILPAVVRDYQIHNFVAFAAKNNPASTITLLNAGFLIVEGAQRAVHLNDAALCLQKFEKSASHG